MTPTRKDVRAAAAAFGRLGGMKGGKATTRKKAQAARENGRKGGRPPRGKAAA
jgi:hypothetical protein